MKKENVNKCNKCCQKTSSQNSLIQLKDNNWYCISCICHYKDIFDLLKIKSYWYNLLKGSVHFKL